MRCPSLLSHHNREPSRIDEMARQLIESTSDAEASAQLLSDPRFARLYHERHAPKVGDVASLRALPSGSLGRQLLAFRCHYQLAGNFFPIGVSLDAHTTPLDYAVYLLNGLHDLMHVVCAYETTDGDEVAIESFLLAQLPLPLSMFVDYCLRHPEIHAARYKHLRDMGAAFISWPDYERGRQAEILVFANLDRRLGEPIASLRSALKVAKREHSPSAVNTCRERHIGPFWNSTQAR